MLRRVLVAAVLAADPPLALFDEPTSGVDPSARWAVFDAIRKWSRTFIVATHDADLLRRCSTEHVLRLYRGRAVQDGPARGDGGGGARSAGPAGDGGPKGDGGPAGEGGATP
jgi:ABC-type multidrug transport system ATPase subunit